MKILFCGTPSFAADILQNLVDTHDVKAVITQRAKPAGRGRVITPSPVKDIATLHNLNVHEPLPSELSDVILSYRGKIDIVLVIAFGMLFEKKITDEFYCINLHASLLPYLRGASPVQTSILSGFSNLGMSLIKMNERMDAGNILAQLPLHIRGDALNVFSEIAKLAPAFINDTLDRLCDIDPLPQDESQATYCKKITKADGKLDLYSARDCWLKYLAFIIWPGVFVLAGGSRLKVTSLRLIDEHTPGIPGNVNLGSEVGISCKSGVLCFERVIPEGRREMSACDFFRTSGITVVE